MSRKKVTNVTKDAQEVRSPVYHNNHLGLMAAISALVLIGGLFATFFIMLFNVK